MRGSSRGPDDRRFDRRALVRFGVLSAGSATLFGCVSEGRDERDGDPVRPTAADGHARGRLTYRPGSGAMGTARGRTGRFELEVGGGRPAAVLVPEGTGPLRLVVVLHGAGGEPARTRQLLADHAEEHRLLLVAPASRRTTWDAIQGGFGPDVAMIDDLLARVAADHAVSGVAVAGFSDGASYALTLGIGNGDVFDSVVAFSPGFAAPLAQHGEPRFFVSHGTGDEVLPIDWSSRRLVPELERAGYDITYEEFDGGHEVPAVIRERAVTWLGASAPRGSA